MKHNRCGFKPGDIAILDAKYRNWSKIKILSFTPNQMFATIYPVDGNEKDNWEVMTNRLTPEKL